VARAELESVFAQGLAIPSSIYFLDARGEVAVASVGDSGAGTAWPVAGTLTRVSWSRRPHGQVQMTLKDGAGAAFFGEPRNVLTRVIARFSDLELAPTVSASLQYHLADRERTKAGLLQPQRDLDLALLAKIDREIAEAATTQGLAEVRVPATKGQEPRGVEFAAPQDALRTADQIVFLRQVVRAVVRANDCDATFMAKPLLDAPANGMRLRVGMRRGADSVFATSDGSDLVRAAVGGLQAVMAESLALFLPSANSFRRFGGADGVARNRRWGYLNKSANISIGRGGDEGAPYIEIATAGADSNPYLALAAILAGIHHGITQGLDAGTATDADVGALVDPTLPATIDAALLALENGAVLREYLGPAYVDLYCSAKRTELERFRRFIPAHEYDWYL
jgi:glutamine synthetase